MNVEKTLNQVSAEELENVTGGMAFLPHKRLEKELKDLWTPDAGNLSDYVGEFGVEGRIPYIGN
jgi:hypothetical protein